MSWSLPRGRKTAALCRCAYLCVCADGFRAVRCPPLYLPVFLLGDNKGRRAAGTAEVSDPRGPVGVGGGLV